MTITKNSVVSYRWKKEIDYGVISKIEYKAGHDKHWSAWSRYFVSSQCDIEPLTLIGPPILGVFNDEGN